MQTRQSYLSWLAVLSAIGVFGLHANSFWVGPSRTFSWFTANMIESIFYVAVPIFFMISGATLLDYRERYDTKTYLRKRFVKAVIPWIFWSLICMAVSILNGWGGPTGIRSTIVALVNSSVNGYFWFFPTLYIIYVLIIPLSLIPKDNRPKVFSFLIIAMLLLNYGFPVLFSWLNMEWNSSLTIFGGTEVYIEYVMAGWLLSHLELKKKYRVLLYVCGLIGLLLICLPTWFESLATGEITNVWHNAANIPAFLYACSIFTSVKTFCNNSKEKGWFIRLNSVVVPMQQLTFGVYLLQWFILTPMKHNCWEIVSQPLPRFGVFISGVSCLFLIVYLIRKTRIGRKLIP